MEEVEPVKASSLKVGDIARVGDERLSAFRKATSKFPTWVEGRYRICLEWEGGAGPIAYHPDTLFLREVKEN